MHNVYDANDKQLININAFITMKITTIIDYHVKSILWAMKTIILK